MAARVSRSILLCLVLAVAITCVAQGGPPLLTDDPGTPGNENFEINVGFTAERHPTERIYNAPLLDINYGLGSRIQLKYESPLVIYGTDGASTKSGWGNSLAGLKWRFFQNENHEFYVSTYPQLEFNNPTHSVERGIADRGPAFLLPVEIAKKLGPVDLNLEGGHWFSRDNPQWITGIAVGRQQTKRIELLAEVYHISAARPERFTIFDVGARVKLFNPVLLIFSAGRSFRGPGSGEPQFIGYGGLQFLLLDKWEPEDHPGETKRP